MECEVLSVLDVGEPNRMRSEAEMCCGRRGDHTGAGTLSFIGLNRFNLDKVSPGHTSQSQATPQ